MTTAHPSMKRFDASAVKRRYRARLLGGLGAYVGAIFGVSTLLEADTPVTLSSVAIALLPGFGILIVLYALWRYVSEVDEVGRFFLTRSLIIALFGTLALSGVWGVAELMLDGLPQLPVFWLFPVAIGLFGLANMFSPDCAGTCA